MHFRAIYFGLKYTGAIMAFMMTEGYEKLTFRVEALKSQHSRQKPKASSTNLKGFGFSLYPKLFKGCPSHSGDNMHFRDIYF